MERNRHPAAIAADSTDTPSRFARSMSQQNLDGGNFFSSTFRSFRIWRSTSCWSRVS